MGSWSSRPQSRSCSSSLGTLVITGRALRNTAFGHLLPPGERRAGAGEAAISHASEAPFRTRTGDPPESWLPRDTSVDRLDETPDLPDASRDPPGVCSTTCSRTSLRGRLRPDERATRRVHRIFIDSSQQEPRSPSSPRREGATVGGRYVEVKGSRQSPRRWISRLARRSERPGALGRHPTPPLRAPFLFACGVQLGRGIGAGELLDGGKHG